MAIVKILKSSKKFAAVSYNDKRVLNGEAELVKAVNFGKFSSLVGFQECLNHWGDENKKIKNKQFHVTISPVKDEMSKEELIKLGELWLKEMGYGNNPYLIYYHDNTELPHIHIVTSRLDRNGNKINDSFENERALRVLQRLQIKSELASHRKTIASLLKYSFTTKYQIMELCVKNGFSVKNTKEGLSCERGGEKIILSNSLIEFCSERYRRNIDLKEKKKMQSLIYKYAAILPRDKFTSFMRQKFGLEFVFYGKQKDINGYTIIDYKNKIIYKGSEIFGAKKISELFDIPKKMNDYDLIVQEILHSHPYCVYDEFKTILSNSYLYEINGNIIKDPVKDEEFEINSELLEKFNYNRNLRLWAETFKPYNEELAHIVASMVHVRLSDMRKFSNYEKPDKSIIEHFNKLLKEGLEAEMNLRDFMNSNHVCLIISDNKYYLIDYISRVSVSSDDLDFKFKDVLDKVHQFDDSYRRVLSDDYETASSLEEIFESALSVIDFTGLFFTGSVGGAKNNKRRQKRNP